MPDDLPPFSSNESDAEERQLCVRCLAPNQPSAHFCLDCGCPLSSYAATAPFESLFAEGHLYRQAVECPYRPIILIGMWLIFGCAGLAGLRFIANGEDAASLFGGGVVLLFSGIILTKTTRRFLQLRHHHG